jgi:hypothetical protein
MQSKKDAKRDARAEHPAGRAANKSTAALQERVWTRRWQALKEHHDLTYSQAVAVYDLLNDTRAFGSLTLAQSAMDQLSEVYGMPTRG